MKAPWFVVAFFVGALSVASAISSRAFAAAFTGTGYVESLTVHDKTQIGIDMDWVTIVGFDSAGTCAKKAGSTRVIARIKSDTSGDRLESILLSAKLAGKAVTVSVDDSFKDSQGYCWLRYVRLD